MMSAELYRSYLWIRSGPTMSFSSDTAPSGTIWPAALRVFRRETCAVVALIMWNWRLLQLTGDARYADLIETGLYNGMLSGVSLDGREYFYANPLACDGGLKRRPWYLVACCPPNIARTLASLPGYLFSGGDGVWIHQYASGSATLS